MILVGVAVAVLIVIAILVIRKGEHHQKRAYAEGLNKAIHTFTNAETGPRPRLQEPSNFPTKQITFPLIYLSTTKAFAIEFYINANKFIAIPDTGSSYLVLGGTQCEVCLASNGIYGMTGRRTGKTSSIRYGSQTASLDWYEDDIKAPHSTVRMRVDFGVAKSGSASDQFWNVLGLARSKTHKSKTSFLDQLMYEQQILAPYFYFDFSHGTTDAALVLGAYAKGHVNAPLQLQEEQQVAKTLGLDLGFNYYMIRLVQVRIDGAPVMNAPKFCMLDTGNSQLSCDSAFYKSLQSLFGEGETLELEFERDVKLTYSLTDDVRQNIGAEPGLLDRDGFRGNVCILGNQFMLGHMWSFDLFRNTLRIL